MRVSRSIPTQLKNEAVDGNGVTALSAKEKVSDQYRSMNHLHYYQTSFFPFNSNFKLTVGIRLFAAAFICNSSRSQGKPSGAEIGTPCNRRFLCRPRRFHTKDQLEARPHRFV